MEYDTLEKIRLQCRLCNGAGSTVVSRTNKRTITQECSCARKIRELEFLGPQLAGAPRIESSPLSRTKTVFVTANWVSLLPHLRYILLALRERKHDLTKAIITDQQIKEAQFIAGTSPTALVTGPDLVVIRLGFIGQKHEGAAGHLLTALMDRVELQGRPVWLVEAPNRPFKNGHSWSQELDDYVADNFQRVQL